ncbi:MAG: hypothetical protein ACOVOT_03310 [Rubrivivax sp.]|jgi:hypothetical protein|nr:hypothetical protein [Rubrivivax sp.]
MNGLSDADLDELLRRDFAGPIADDGFAARVSGALPPRPRQRAWLIPAAAVAGGLLTWLTVLPSPLLQQAAREWLAGSIGPTSGTVLALLLGLGLLGCAWALEEEA